MSVIKISRIRMHAIGFLRIFTLHFENIGVNHISENGKESGSQKSRLGDPARNAAAEENLRQNAHEKGRPKYHGSQQIDSKNFRKILRPLDLAI